MSKNNKKQVTHDKLRSTSLDANALDQPLREDHIVVPLVEEQLQVEKQWKEAGAALIKKSVETVTEEIPVELAHEEVEVQRVAVNRVLAEGESAAPRQEGDTLIIPVIEEEVVVLKRRVVREELRVTKQRLVRQETIRDTVRKERINLSSAGQVEVLDDAGTQAP